ncbi:MAG: hypothetical protein D6741_12445 [Planctomycetota bacterium]|nr:MAG: hypothetical protein D6741_12445 [Planctomycetota bacterium]
MARKQNRYLRYANDFARRILVGFSSSCRPCDGERLSKAFWRSLSGRGAVAVTACGLVGWEIDGTSTNKLATGRSYLAATNAVMLRCTLVEPTMLW